MSQERQTKLSVSKKEVKYLLSLSDRLFLLDALDHILTPDAYGGYDGLPYAAYILTVLQTRTI